MYLKWRSSSQNRVFDIPQSVANVGKCEKSCPFSDAQECVYNVYNVYIYTKCESVSECFTDVTDITSYTIEFIHDAQKEIERRRIFQIENVAYLLGKSVFITSSFYLAKPPFRLQWFSLGNLLSSIKTACYIAYNP